MTIKRNFITLVLCFIVYQAEAGDKEIWPIPTECPKIDPLEYTVHLQHESDCTKFYKCDHGKKVEFDCPAGLHFNKVLQVCDWPGNAGCENVNPNPTTKSTQEPTSSETPKPTPPEDRDPECPWPDPLNYTVHLPHETDCTKFYKCDHGKKVEFDCPNDLHFNPDLEVCDWPENAGCEDPNPGPCPSEDTDEPQPEPEPTSPSDLDPECPWPDPLNYTVHLPHETDCTKFYKCDNGKKVEFDCPNDLHFNPKLEVCDWPEDAGCENQSIQCPDTQCQDTTLYLPVLGNQRKYIRCVGGVEVINTCPGGLVFDKNLATCNLEHLVVPN
ncbi:probable chitinase 10 isoform X2 [Tribolium madens]|uniref:probable chitinase 10 isoform X2 n=1 Tax=Tribolium madens TaxID=41895 RepID=UPI001CF73FCE|nr:probable chitinase 10 isoform X2 [Tribolium madens]